MYKKWPCPRSEKEDTAKATDETRRDETARAEKRHKGNEGMKIF
jgi:hypothetical protein